MKKLTNEASVHGEGTLERLAYLDGWRGLAIAFVLADHFLSFTVFESGLLGVNIFFCLSGLLMSRILYVKRTNLTHFYKRRISRILPAFILFVVTVYTVSFLVGMPHSWIEFLSTLAFLRTYIPETPNIWQAEIPIGHLWSLNVEEHCYVLMSLLTLPLLLRGKEGGLLIGLAILAAMTHVWYIEVPALGVILPEIRTETASATLLASAGYHLVKDRWADRIKPWMPLAAFGIAILSYSTYVPWWSSILIAPFMLAFAVNHLDGTYQLVRAALAVPPLRLLGIWSYSIYLWQHPFQAYKSAFIPGTAFLAAMLMGVCSFYLFENPIRNWLNRNW